MSWGEPVGQKRLTNIAVVRYKSHGVRFEIACYRSTVLAWRNKIEKDLDEVLQTDTIYTNVSKGVQSKTEDLQRAFGTTDQRAICVQILEKGELQVSDKERQSELDTLFRDVVQVLVEKCVNPDTRRPYTHGVLDRAVRALHFNPDPKRSAKQQALELLPRLQEQFPIERAAMRFQLQVGLAHERALRDLLASHGATLERDSVGPAAVTLVCTVEPGAFRVLDTFMRAECAGTGRLEVLSLAVTAEGSSGGDFDLTPAPASRGTAAMPSISGAQLVQQLAQASLAPPPPAAAPLRGGEPASSGGGGGGVLYARGPIAGIPEAYAARRERFAELDALQAGWEVELSAKAGAATVDAAFFSPAGERVRSFVDARRAALKAKGGGGGGEGA